MGWFKKPREKKIDVANDLAALQDFLADLPADIKLLQHDLLELSELEEESKVHKAEIFHVNLETQAQVIGKILQRYQFFQDDADINGLRIKNISQNFLRRAEKAGLSDLVKEKKKTWKLNF